MLGCSLSMLMPPDVANIITAVELFFSFRNVAAGISRWPNGSVNRQFWHKTGLSYSLFTPPTRTRQDCLVLSCLDPVSNFQVFSNPYYMYIWDWTVADWKLGRDGTKLSCLVFRQFCSRRRHRQDKTRREHETVLSCPCRRCEQAVTDDGKLVCKNQNKTIWTFH